MGSRDRPHREAKKKAKGASTNKVQGFLEPPANVEVIKPQRKPRSPSEASDETGEG